MKRWPQFSDTLSRRDLEQNRMREIYAAAIDPSCAMTDIDLSESLTSTLAAKPKGAGWWIFAYGSLLWNPLFPVAEMRPAMLVGLHRRFCLWSLASRGTRECPGLVLGLDRGGSCRGVAMRLPAPLALDELHLLWRREMVANSYRPTWVRLAGDQRELIALTFVVRRKHPQYAGKLTLDKEVEVLDRACGAFGTSLDYLERTRVALVSHGIVDPYLEKLAARLAAQRGNAASAAAAAGAADV